MFKSRRNCTTVTDFHSDDETVKPTVTIHTRRARAGVALRLVAVTPPPSYKLQTQAARSREIIHCIRLRREEAPSDSTGRQTSTDLGNTEKSDC